jgi:hypothetical protein
MFLKVIGDLKEVGERQVVNPFFPAQQSKVVTGENQIGFVDGATIRIPVTDENPKVAGPRQRSDSLSLAAAAEATASEEVGKGWMKKAIDKVRPVGMNVEMIDTEPLQERLDIKVETVRKQMQRDVAALDHTQKLAKAGPQLDLQQLVYHLFARCVEISTLSQQTFPGVNASLHPESNATEVVPGGEVVEECRANIGSANGAVEV